MNLPAIRRQQLETPVRAPKEPVFIGIRCETLDSQIYSAVFRKLLDAKSLLAPNQQLIVFSPDANSLRARYGKALDIGFSSSESDFDKTEEWIAIYRDNQPYGNTPNKHLVRIGTNRKNDLRLNKRGPDALYPTNVYLDQPRSLPPNDNPAYKTAPAWKPGNLPINNPWLI